MNGHSNVMTDTVQRKYWNSGDVSKQLNVKRAHLMYLADKLLDNRRNGKWRKFTEMDINFLSGHIIFIKAWTPTMGETKRRGLKDRDLQFCVTEWSLLRNTGWWLWLLRWRWRTWILPLLHLWQNIDNNQNFRQLSRTWDKHPRKGVFWMKRIKQLIRNLIYLSRIDLEKELKPTVKGDLLRGY